MAVSAGFQRVTFMTATWSSALENVDGGFVYLDPPYVQEVVTSFVGYTADGFNEHEALFTRCHELPNFLLSNASVPIVHTSFPEAEYETTVVSALRSIHSTAPGTRTNEVLIRRRYPP